MADATARRAPALAATCVGGWVSGCVKCSGVGGSGGGGGGGGGGVCAHAQE